MSAGIVVAGCRCAVRPTALPGRTRAPGYRSGPGRPYQKRCRVYRGTPSCVNAARWGARDRRDHRPRPRRHARSRGVPAMWGGGVRRVSPEYRGRPATPWLARVAPGIYMTLFAVAPRGPRVRARRAPAVLDDAVRPRAPVDRGAAPRATRARQGSGKNSASTASPIPLHRSLAQLNSGRDTSGKTRSAHPILSSTWQRAMASQ